MIQRDSEFGREHLYNMTSYGAFNNSLAKSKEPMVYFSSARQNAILAAPNFSTYLRTPLPVDQKLLSLMHFNLVRAFTANILILGLSPGDMESDIDSPFNSVLNGSPQVSISLGKLPPTLRPTRLQCTTRHHPEIDIFPFPAYRDNLLLAGTAIDDHQLCIDIFFGVESSETSEGTRRNCQDGPFSTSGRTGLIVWDDPWKPESWEVDEGFARKYKSLLRGCDALLKSSNYWRSMRGERRLVLEDN